MVTTEAEQTAAVDRLRAVCEAAGITVSLLGLVRESDVARLFAVSTRTIRSWRYDGSGPRATRIGAAVWYPLAGLVEYLGKAGEERGRTSVAAVGEGGEDAADNPSRIGIGRK